MAIKLRQKNYGCLNTDALFLAVLKMILWPLENSNLYQMLITDVLTKEFPKSYQMSEKSVLRHLLGESWSSKSYTKLSNILKWATKLENE